MENQKVYLNHKRISNKLPILGAISVGIVIFGLISMKSPKYKYKLSTQETLTKVIERKGLVRPAQFMEIYNTNDSLYQFIDLRSTHDFIKGHLPRAINIPVSKLLNDEYKAILNQDKKINILYYTDQCGACGPWIILTELGYKNNMLLQGGYNYVKENIIDNFAPMSGNFQAEKARYNYSQIVNTTGGSSVAKSSSSSTVAVPVVRKKKKKAEEEGGC